MQLDTDLTREFASQWIKQIKKGEAATRLKEVMDSDISVTPRDEKEREDLVLDWFLNSYVPSWLRPVGLVEEADSLEHFSTWRKFDDETFTRIEGLVHSVVEKLQEQLEEYKLGAANGNLPKKYKASFKKGGMDKVESTIQDAIDTSMNGEGVTFLKSKIKKFVPTGREKWLLGDLENAVTLAKKVILLGKGEIDELSEQAAVSVLNLVDNMASVRKGKKVLQPTV